MIGGAIKNDELEGVKTPTGELLHADTTSKIIKAYYTVYNALGAGFLEKVYKSAMVLKLRYRGMKVSVEQPIKISYRGGEIGVFFAGIVVEDCVILELKAASELVQEHRSQLMNYLKASAYEVGLLMNFAPEPAYERKVYRDQFKELLPRFRIAGNAS